MTLADFSWTWQSGQGRRLIERLKELGDERADAEPQDQRLM